MSAINFSSKLIKIGSWTVVVLPKTASALLPSRGMTMVQGTINGHHFQAALEPDGKRSHWFRVDEAMSIGAHVNVGDTVELVIEPVAEWPEPTVPADLKKALVSSPLAQSLWKDITPMARWDWIRWTRGTKNPETREHRIKVALSKLKSGDRRPCCFNRTVCTEPYVSNNGVLLEPSEK